ncbi:MAG: DUF3256 family protein [Bacteroidaceae bacterium]|nr:DUF3256 family protein [Bacteroidaceae bacterium]
MKDLFLKMPVELLPLLKENDRLDLIDLYEAKMNIPVTNRLDGKSSIKMLTDNYMYLTLSASSSMQIKMLTDVSGDTLLCVVNTVSAEAADSRIRLYKNDWQPVENGFFDTPAIADFFIQSDSTKEALELADIYLVELNLSPEDNTLVAEYTLPRYMNKEDAARILPLLHKIVYIWDGRGFVPGK